MGVTGADSVAASAGALVGSASASVGATDAGGVGVAADHPQALSSELVGWLEREAVLGRVVLALPW